MREHIKDGFEATFIVSLQADDVWQAITQPAPAAEDGTPRYHLAGFPAFGRTDGRGALCTELEVDTVHLLRVRKDEMPCDGTEIMIVLEAEDTGTRITVVQSGFGAWLDAVRDTFAAHWIQIVADLQLFIERGINVPGTVWGADLGVMTKQTPTGLELAVVNAGGFGERVGMQAGDLLLTVRGLRVHDTQQLWTIMGLSSAGDETDASWARGRELMQGRAVL